MVIMASSLAELGINGHMMTYDNIKQTKKILYKHLFVVNKLIRRRTRFDSLCMH